MSKQVTKATVQAPVSTNNSTSPQQSNNLYMSVLTFDPQGKTIGERIVDLYHFGTRSWLQKHFWWAMHNGHCVEVNVAKPEEIEAYLASGKELLAEKFNAPKANEVVAEAIAA